MKARCCEAMLCKAKTRQRQSERKVETKKGKGDFFSCELQAALDIMENENDGP